MGSINCKGSILIGGCKSVGGNKCPSADDCVADPDVTFAEVSAILEDGSVKERSDQSK